MRPARISSSAERPRSTHPKALSTRVALPDLRRAVASRSEDAFQLSSLLLQVLQSHTTTPLKAALRPEETGPIDPEAALARMLVFLARSSKEGTVNLEVLAKLGPEGEEAAVALDRILARPGTFADAPRHAETILARARGFVRSEELGLLNLLGPQPLATSLPAVDAAKAVGSVSRAPPPVSIPLAQLGLQLGYGSSDLLQTVREATQQDSGLRRALLHGITSNDLGDAEAAAVLLRLLAQFRDPRGEIRIDRLITTFGPSAEPLSKALGALGRREPPLRPNTEFLAQVLRRLPEIMPRKAAVGLADDLVRNDQLIPKSVAPLEAVSKQVKKNALSGTGLIAVQHLFPTLVPLLESLVAKGMSPKDIHVLGTDYTPNPLVEAYCRLLGMDVTMGYDSGGETKTFEEMRARQVSTMLDAVSREPDGPKQGFIVLDDGGMVHRGLSETPALAPLRQKVLRGVEQTTRGLTELEKLESLPYPIVRVADSVAKKTQEAPIIGWSLVESLLRELTHHGKEVQNVTVVSAGAIGLEVAHHLKALGKQVTVVDRDPAKLATAAARGFVTRGKVEEALEGTDLVFSCTGKRALDARSLAGYSGLVASGSSAAIELDIHELSAFTGVRALNRGRPINFLGDGFENLPKDAIGLTRALLFSAIAQPVSGEGSWLHLDPRLESTAVQASQTARSSLGSPQLPLRSAPRPDEVPGTVEPGAWETFLRNHPFPVLPPPSSAHAFTNKSIFRDRDGALRLVDFETRRSVELPFREMPDAIVGGLRQGFLTGKDASGGWVRTIEKIDGEWKVGPRQAGGPCVGSWPGPDLIHWGYVFEGKDQILVFDPGKTSEPRKIPRAFSGSSAYCLQLSGAIDQIDLETRQVRRLSGEGPAIRVPEGWKKLDAIINHRFRPVMIGTTVSGQTAVAWGDGGPDVKLPPGARFREVHGPSREEARVSFVPEGGVDEVDAHESLALPQARSVAERPPSLR